MWDGERWIPLGSGAVPGVNASADAMSSNGTELYAGGIFRIGPAETARTVAVWHIPHTLKVTRDGDALALSWPAPETNAVLEATKSLVSPDWQPVSASPALVNRRLTVTNLPAAGQRFYRLRQP
jgi:hypothetical protein